MPNYQYPNRSANETQHGDASIYDQSSFTDFQGFTVKRPKTLKFKSIFKFEFKNSKLKLKSKLEFRIDAVIYEIDLKSIAYRITCYGGWPNFDTPWTTYNMFLNCQGSIETAAPQLHDHSFSTVLNISWMRCSRIFYLKLKI